MVPLEDRIKYQDRVLQTPKLREFYNFLFENKLNLNSEFADADDQFYQILLSLSENNKKGFLEAYKKKSKSKPQKDSVLPFINDDFLLFCFLVGIMRFQLDKDWLIHVLSVRNRSPITITLENILNENYYSKSNIPAIVLAYLIINNISLVTEELLNDTLRSISGNTELFNDRSDFKILTSLRAYDYVIEIKTPIKGGKIDLLQKFERRFVKRIKLLSIVINSILLCFFLLGLLKLPEYSPEAVEVIDKYGFAFSIIGAIGISLIGNQIPIIKKLSNRLLMWFFGYPKGLTSE